MRPRRAVVTGAQAGETPPGAAAEGGGRDEFSAGGDPVRESAAAPVGAAHADPGARLRRELLELGRFALESESANAVVGRALEFLEQRIGLTSGEVWGYEPSHGELVLMNLRRAGLSTLPDGWSEGERRAAVEAVIAGGPTGAPDPSGLLAVIRGPQGALGAITGTRVESEPPSEAERDLVEAVAQILATTLELRRTSQSLSRAESRLDSLIERLPSVTYRAGLGETGTWHYVSPQVEEMVGYSPDECVRNGYWWERCVHPDDLPGVLAEESRCASLGLPLDVEYRMRARDGRQIWVRDRAAVAREVGGEMVAEGMFVDITAQKKAEDDLRHLATHDHLTGLLNRRGFETAVDEWLASDRSANAAMAILDFDHLKHVNDALGHAGGDRVLSEAASVIAASLRAGDVLGRLSGDEFGLFLPDSDKSQAHQICSRVLGLVRDCTTDLTVSVSIGVTELPEGGKTTAAQLLVSADQALYRAKAAGRDRLAFTQPADSERLEWASAVRDAVEADRLILHGQPIVDSGSGERRSFELLARMIGPDGNPVAGANFIPIAERFGLIRRVDRWVVERAVRLAAAGHPVSVNISAASLADAALTDQVERQLRAAGAPDPSLLTFEITETVATPAYETLIDFATRIGGLGCRLSLDDVGTGFGSFTYLRSIPFSELKIDVQFVVGLPDSPTDERIVRALVGVAREFSLRTVAEGVESEAILEHVRKLGVHCAQGHHIGGPGPLPLEMQRHI